MTRDSRAVRPQGTRRPAWDLPLRILSALAGGYVLTSLATMLLARSLPGNPLDTAIAATLSSFAIYTAAVVWVFASRNALAVTGWLLGLILLSGAAVWLSSQTGALS